MVKDEKKIIPSRDKGWLRFTGFLTFVTAAVLAVVASRFSDKKDVGPTPGPTANNKAPFLPPVDKGTPKTTTKDKGTTETPPKDKGGTTETPKKEESKLTATQAENVKNLTGRKFEVSFDLPNQNKFGLPGKFEVKEAVFDGKAYVLKGEYTHYSDANKRDVSSSGSFTGRLSQGGNLKMEYAQKAPLNSDFQATLGVHTTTPNVPTKTPEWLFGGYIIGKWYNRYKQEGSIRMVAQGMPIIDGPVSNADKEILKKQVVRLEVPTPMGGSQAVLVDLSAPTKTIVADEKGTLFPERAYFRNGVPVNDPKMANGVTVQKIIREGTGNHVRLVTEVTSYPLTNGKEGKAVGEPAVSITNLLFTKDEAGNAEVIATRMHLVKGQPVVNSPIPASVVERPKELGPKR